MKQVWTFFLVLVVGGGVFLYQNIGKTGFGAGINREILTIKDAIADILPPPFFMIEAYLLMHRYVDLDAGERQNATASIERFQKNFANSYDHWKHQDLYQDSNIRTKIQAVFETGEATFLAFEKLRNSVAKRVRPSPVDVDGISRSFDEHRQKIGELVVALKEREAKLQAQATVNLQQYQLVIKSVFGVLFILGIGLWLKAYKRDNEYKLLLMNYYQDLVTSLELEKKKMAIELHDGVIQLVGSAKYRLTNLIHALGDSLPELRQGIASSCEILTQAITSLRNLSHELRPHLLDKVGVYSAIHQFLEDFSNASQISIHEEFEVEEAKINEDLSLALYRIIQECLRNSAKHSNPESIELSIREEARAMLKLTIKDLHPRRTTSSESMSQENSGLGHLHIRERVNALGGTVKFTNTPANGFEVETLIPLNNDKQNQMSQEIKKAGRAA